MTPHIFIQLKNRFFKKHLLLPAFISFIISLILGFIYLRHTSSASIPISPQVAGAVSQPNLTPSAATPVPTPPEDLNHLGVLLLGYGGPGHEGSYLTDAIILAYFNFDQKYLSLISIPRDTWITFPDNINRKVNTALVTSTPSTQGTLKEQVKGLNSGLAKQIVTDITNLPVNYFIGIDFVGLERTVGIELKGIEVNVPQTFDDPWYPSRELAGQNCGYTPEEIAALTARYSGFELEKQFPCRYEHLHYEPGLNHMEGGDALKYARSRHSTSDFDRSKRQQAVIEGMKNKLLDLGALNDTANFFLKLSHHVTTDIDTSIIEYLHPALLNLPGFSIININLSTENVLQTSQSNTGAFILIPQSGSNNWTNTHSYIQSQLNQ